MKTYTKVLLALVALSSLNSYGQAVLSPSCPVASKIKLPSNSSGFFMSEDCKTVYVLPPELGKISLTSVRPFMLDRCDEAKTHMKTLKNIAKRLAVSAPDHQENYVEPEYRPNSNRYETPVQPQRELTDAEISALMASKKNATESLLELGKIPGARIGLAYLTGYGDFVSQARTKNSRLGLNFTHLPLKNMKINFNTPDRKLSDFNIALSGHLPSDADTIMTGSLSASLELSLLGACELRSAYSDTIDSDLTSADFSALLPLNLNYEYDVISKVAYKATYSKGGLAEKIREKSTRGGMFSSKTVSKLINTARTESWFNYEYTCDDSRACEQAHDENILEIKKRLMDEVITNIVLVKTEYLIPALESDSPGANGAQIASRELKKCPHIYCQIAAGVLDVVNAAVGSTSKTDKYINTEKHTVTESVSVQKAYPFRGSMGFGAKE